MTAFMDKDFLLTTDVAKKLYHEVAADLPVIDYHSHLQQGEIAERRSKTGRLCHGPVRLVGKLLER